MLTRSYNIEEKEQDFIFIDWDIFNMCNYKCTYCIMQYNKDDWLKIGNFKKQQRIMKALGSIQMPLRLSLLGGEPTMHPQWESFMEELSETVLAGRPDNQITIVSNMTKMERLLMLDVKKYPNYQLMLSFHSEEADPETYVKDLGRLVEHGFKIYLNVLLHPKRMYWESIKKFIGDVNDLYGDKVQIETTLILFGERTSSRSPDKADKMVTGKYSQEFIDFFRPIHSDWRELDSDLPREKGLYVFEHEDGTEEYFDNFTINDAHQKGYTNFHGWDCFINGYKINIDGNMSLYCVGENVASGGDAIEKYFENMTKVNHRKCPYYICNLDCFLSMRKENPDRLENEKYLPQDKYGTIDIPIKAV